MGHEHLAGSLVELMQILTTAPGSNPLFHPPPEAFDRIEVMATVGREEMQLELILIMVECGGQFAGAVNATTINYHDALFLCRAKEAHHLRDILTELVGIKVGHDFIEHAGGAVLHRTDDIEQ